MKITDNIYMMELAMNMGGIKSIIHPTLIWDDDNVILVDAGLPGGLSGYSRGNE